MDKLIKVIMIERDSIDSNPIDHGDDNDMGALGIQETLLIHDPRPEVSVSRLYLLRLTSGVGGQVKTLRNT